MNKAAIIGVFAVFLLPVIAATLLHSQWFEWQPGGGRNHGQLISPVVPIPPFEISDARGRPASREQLLERWHLVYLQRGECGEPCLESLYWLRQVRRAQDRHQPEVGLLFVSDQIQTEEITAAIAELAEDYMQLTGPDAPALLGELPAADVKAAYYITDPMANIIMSYPEDAEPNGIRRDLRRLLTWTQRN